jgi:hypothetical protein
VYRWKSEAAGRGETADWDAARRVYNLSPRELVAIYAEALKKWVVEIKRDPALLSDGKTADAIAKHVSVLQKLDTRSQYLGAVMDVVRLSNEWLSANNPKLQADMAPCWDGIMRYIQEKAGNQSLVS